MKYCHSCGAENEDDAVFCQACGSKQDDAPAEPAAEVAANAAEQPAEQSTAWPTVDAPSEQPVQQTNGGFKNKVNAVVQKTKTFDAKHNIIVNAIVLVCAIVVLFVALFAPIKVVAYEFPIAEEDGDDVEICYTEIDQSIFQVIGSLFYFNASEKQLEELDKQYREVRENASKEIAAWALKHSDATEEEVYRASIEIMADCMSDMNYLGFMIANIDFEEFTDGSMIDVIITAAFGAVIALVSIILAIISLVYIIKAIINIVKKQPQTGLFKYLSAVLAVSIYGLTFMFCAPLLKAGGNLFAVALFTAIANLITAGVGGLIVGKDHKLVVLKRSVIALLSMIAFFILCSDVFSIVDKSSESYTKTTYATTGYGIHSMVGVMQFGEGAPDMSLMLANTLIGLIMYFIVAGIIVSYVSQVMRRSFRRLSFGDVKKSNTMAYAIAAAVFSLAAIIVGFMSDTLTSSFFGIFDLPKVEVQVRWLIRAQVWVCMFFMIAVAVFGKVFLPNDTVNGNGEELQSAQQPQQSEQPQQQPQQDEII